MGEPGIASGVTFTSGKYGQAAAFDATAVLSYTVGWATLGRMAGSVEFWVRPDWDGDDHLNHTFYEVGQAWENGMLIMKDGADNLRFLTWNELGHEYGLHCPVGDWQAGEWRHVAAAWSEGWMLLAVDGFPCKTITDGDITHPEIENRAIYIGNSRLGGQPAQAAIDELRISEYPRFGNTDQLRILMAEAGSRNRVAALDGLGNLKAAFGSSGSGNEQLNDPRGLALDAAGNIIVVDRGNNRLQVLGFDGSAFTYLRTLSGGFNHPSGVATYLGWVVVADTGNNQVKILDPAGNLAGTYDEPDDGMLVHMAFNAPQGVTVDRWGRIIVADSGLGRVVRLVQTVLPKIYTYLPVLRR